MLKSKILIFPSSNSMAFLYSPKPIWRIPLYALQIPINPHKKQFITTKITKVFLNICFIFSPYFKVSNVFIKAFATSSAEYSASAIVLASVPTSKSIEPVVKFWLYFAVRSNKGLARVG